MRAIGYVRISKDPDENRRGVERQRKLVRDLVESHGWELVDVFEDNDVSAYGRRDRPGWEAALATVRRGEADALVAYANDRLTRHPRELEDLIDLLERTGVKVVTVSSGEYDLSTPEGRATARIVGAIARQESERKARRQVDANRESASRGQRVGGNRPFGYTLDGFVDDEEAAEIRWAVQQVLRGESISSVSRRWNEKGVLTTRGNAWSSTRVSELLRNPRYMGKRTYRGEVVADAEWDALVDEDSWHALQSLLSAPDRRWKGGPLKRWLTRAATCGKCGEPLVSGSVSRAKGALYTCSGVNGCYGISVRADVAEFYVERLILSALTTSTALARIRAVAAGGTAIDDLTGELAQVSALITQLDDDYYGGKLDRARWIRQADRLSRRLRSLEAERERRLDQRLAVSIPEDDVEQWWTAASPSAKRDVVRLMFKTIRVEPARQLGGRVDTERFAVEWAA